MLLQVALISYGVNRPTVTLPLGAVEGVVEGSMRVFRGIPYAEPPVGALRWRAPVAKAAWKPATLDASHDGAGCPQLCALPALACPTVQSEDCLFLNVFTPLTPPSPTKLLPVGVFIHGGDFFQGFGGGPLYTGKGFVERGTLFVAMNYRLGALGFAYSGDASKHSDDLTGNYGLLDQKLVLEWVKANIEAFGGDPNAVTLFGESAGGMSVGTHAVIPSSAALFHRGIIESEPFALPYRTTKTYPAYTREFAHKAGCGDGVVNLKRFEPCLRGASVKGLLAAQAAVRSTTIAMALSVSDLFIPFSPVVDRDAPRGAADTALVIEDQVLRLWQRQATDSKAAPLPIILGTNADEGTIFVYGVSKTPLTSKTEVDVLLALVFGTLNVEKIKKQYPLPSSGDMRPHLAVIVTDSLFRCPARTAALTRRAANSTGPGVYQYHFDQVWSFSLALWNATDPECNVKCCHANELLGVFDPDLSIIKSAKTAAELAMSAAIQSFWSSFMTNPSATPATDGLPSWPPMTSSKAGSEPTMRFYAQPPAAVAVVQIAADAACSFWDGLNYAWLDKK